MKLMRMREVLEYLDIKKTTFYNYKKQGLPIHYPYGDSGRPYCYKEEIDKWLKERGVHNDRMG